MIELLIPPGLAGKREGQFGNWPIRDPRLRDGAESVAVPEDRCEVGTGSVIELSFNDAATIERGASS